MTETKSVRVGNHTLKEWSDGEKRIVKIDGKNYSGTFSNAVQVLQEVVKRGGTNHG